MPIPKSIQEWIDLFKPFLQRVWIAVQELFERHPVRIAISACFFVAAVITGAVYIDRTKQYQEIISTTVRAQGENTPQRFKVLEAFIMSTIDTKFSEIIENATISDDFHNGLEEMHKVLSNPTPKDEFVVRIKPPNPAGDVRLSIPDFVDKSKLPALQNAILTDNERYGFLFFPLNLLRTSLEKDYKKIYEESRDINRSTTLANVVATDRTIVDDIIVSRKLAPTMQSFTNNPLFKDDKEHSFVKNMRPVQVYYITKNGVNRIVNNTDPSEQKLVYQNMFRSMTFFPSRPYYVGAYKQIGPATLAGVSGSARGAFYVSRPYLDIGGFGVVITLARPVSYPSHSDAAICFDLRVSLEDNIRASLKKRLESFGAKPKDVTCDIGFNGLFEWKKSVDSMDPRLKDDLEFRINETKKTGDLSTVVGNIIILDDQPKQEEVIQASSTSMDIFKYPLEIIFGYNSQPITFVIPLSSPRAPSGAKELEARFMVASLNLERFQQVTSLYGLVSVSLLTLAFSIVLLSWRDEMRILQSYAESFKTVDSVLYGAPTPYCRLDASDTLVDCNIAFCSLLKMQADRKSAQSLIGRTLESLVAPRSRNTYHDVQERRRKGQEVAPYTLFLTCIDESEVETRVTSGAIPGRTHRELPGTFGIFISTSDLRHGN